MSRFIKENLFVFIFKVISAFIGLMLTMVASRELDISDAGKFFVALSIIYVASSFCRQGYENSVVKFMSIENDNSRYDTVLNMYLLVLWVVFRFFLFLGLLLVCFIFFVDKENIILNAGYLWVGLAVLPYSLIYLSSYVFRSIGRSLFAVFFQSVYFPLAIILCFIFAPVDDVKSAFGFLFFTAVMGFVVVFCVFLRVYAPQQSKLGFDKKPAIFNDLSNLAKQLYLVQVLLLVNQWGAQLMLSLFRDSSEVAIFTASNRVALLISFALVAVNIVSSRKYSALYAKGKMSEIQSLYKKSFYLLLGFGLSSLLIIFLFNERILVLFGEQYIDGANLLIIMALGQFVNVATGSVGVILQMTGHERQLQINMCIATLLLFLLGIVLIPSLGATGAAIATAIAIATQNLLGFFYLHRKMGIKVF